MSKEVLGPQEQNPIKHEPTQSLDEAINKLESSPGGSTITILSASPNREDEFQQYIEEKGGLKVRVERHISLTAKPGTYEYEVTLVE